MNAVSPSLPADPGPGDLPRCPFSSEGPGATFSGLNLVLELKDPEQIHELVGVVKAFEDEIRYKMKRLNSVHFARFLPIRGNACLQVITEFDGLLEDYLYDFVIEVGDIFNALLGFIKNPPHLPIQDDPDAFVDFVRRNNQVTLPGFGPAEVSTFSSYRRKSVLEINGRDHPSREETAWWARFEERCRIQNPARYALDQSEAPVPTEDVQANILEPLDAQRAKHFALAIDDPDAARRFLAELADPARGGPVVTSEQVASARSSTGSHTRDHALTLGFTASGLHALGIPDDVLGSFPPAFVEGPLQRAMANRDVGPHRPELWQLGHPDATVHLLLSVHHCRPAGGYTDGARDAFDQLCQRLEARWREAGLRTVHEQQVGLLKNGRFHFGFRDGISQPEIGHRAVEGNGKPHWGGNGPAVGAGNGKQQRSRVGDFLLGSGYANAYGAPSLGKIPAWIGNNGSFAVIRLLEQDVDAFEAMLAQPRRSATQGAGICREYLAAKLLGRWRNGAPLTQAKPRCTAPGPRCGDACMPPLDADNAPLNLNDFNFRTDAQAGQAATDPAVDDFEGLICPIQAHVRRMNPRHARAAGKPSAHRVIRRGLPYVQSRHPSDPTAHRGKTERGLYGIFYCGDIARQFEFLQQRWGYSDRPSLPDPNTSWDKEKSEARQPSPSSLRAQSPGIGDLLCGARGEPIAGAPVDDDDPDALRPGFSFPHEGGEVSLNWSQLVYTRGCLYLFMPGLETLRRIAAGPGAGKVASRQFRTGTPVPDRTSAPSHGIDLDAFDPMDPDVIENPYPYYAAFRRQRGPAARITVGSHYSQVWVFGRQLATEVLSDEKLFAKPLQGWPRQHHERDEDRDRRFYRGLMYQDPPRHAPHRARVEASFLSSLADIETLAGDTAERALDEIIAAGGPRRRGFDAVPTYIDRVPREVFMALFGLPKDLWQRYGDLLNTMLRNFSPIRTAAERAPYGVASRRLIGEMTRLAQSGEARGLFARLLQAGSNLDPIERIQTCLHFAIGGYVSTGFALGTAIHRLLTDPGARAAWAADDAGSKARFLQEVLRFEGPFLTAERRYTGSDGSPFPRLSLADCGGQPIRLLKDEIVTVVLGSAQRDTSDGHQDADRFDPTREALPDWADTSSVFGQGSHRCIGAPMAVKVLPIYIDRWLDAMPDLAMTSMPPVRVPDPAFRGFQSLWLRF